MPIQIQVESVELLSAERTIRCQLELNENNYSNAVSMCQGNKKAFLEKPSLN
jgi:hypothetical protein